MARPHLFAQIYGFAVCLTAVIVALISINDGVQAAFDLADPLHAKDRWGNDVPATFEEFRADQRGQIDHGNDKVLAPADTSARKTSLTDDELRRIYESRRADIVATRHFQATKSLVSNLLLLLVAVVLFVWHWRWLRRLPDTATSTA